MANTLEVLDEHICSAEAQQVSSAQPSAVAPHAAPTLLQKALDARRKKPKGTVPNPENLELALAWLAGRVSNSQVAVAMGVDPGNSHTNHVVYRMAAILRAACVSGLIAVTTKQDRR